MKSTIISLTSIPPRFPHIAPTLRSLAAQSGPIDQVILWIPDTYRRFGIAEFDRSLLPSGVQIRRCPHDLGPATKVLPAVEAFREDDVRIIYCDDDRIYAPDWAGSLISEAENNPGKCITETGEVLEATFMRAFGATWRYQLLTKMTLGWYGHKHRVKLRGLDPHHGHVDIAKGYGGVLIEPGFLPDFAFDLPENLWTVDDVWISGCLAVNGIDILKIAHLPNSDKTDVATMNALIDIADEGLDRHTANLACIRHFQETYGVWQHAPVK